MKRQTRWQWLMLSAMMVAGLDACQGNDLSFLSGRVLDGETGLPIAAYTVTLTVGGSVLNGTVKNNLFSVGPIQPNQDFTLTVAVPGYRPFYSNVAFSAAQKANTGAAAQTFQILREVVVFPSALQSQASTLNVYLSDNATPPSAGIVRLTPVVGAAGAGVDGTSSLLFDPTNPANPGGVGNPGNGVNPADNFFPQNLPNNADLENNTFIKQIGAGGLVSFAVGEFVYGVNYDVEVFGVPNYVLNGTTAPNVITGGNGNTFAVTLTPFSPDTGNTALGIAFDSSVNPGSIDATGTLSLVFNQTIEIDPSLNPAQLIENLYSVTADQFTFNGFGTTNGVTTAFGPINLNAVPNQFTQQAIPVPQCLNTGVTVPQVAMACATTPTIVFGGNMSALKTHTVGQNEYGFAIALDGTSIAPGPAAGQTLSFKWNQGSAFATLAPGDVLTSVKWTVGYIGVRAHGTSIAAVPISGITDASKGAVAGAAFTVTTKVPPVQ